jgi:tetratricopeptide (TPR) repeat protein
MFRRFFKRNGREEEPGGHSSEPPESARQAQEILQHVEQDDGVHRMVLRASKQPLPEDPDEKIYDQDEGEHAEVAQRALQAGDFKRAIYHLGLALADDPARAEWLALLDRWIAATGPRALDFVPLDDEVYFSTLLFSRRLMSQGNTPTHRMEVIPLVGKNYHARVAVHVYILAAQGKVKEAVSLLLQLLQVKPEIPYILWLARWQDQPGFVEALEPGIVASIAVRVMQKYPGTYVFAERGRAEIAQYLPLLRKTYEVISRRKMDEGALTAAFVYAMGLRKTGAFEEAARVARGLPASYQTLVALAMAEDALGNSDASVEAYKRALGLQPDDVAVRNDLGALFLKQGKLDEALAYYEESARIDPSDPFQDALAYSAYIHYLQTPADEWVEKLKTLAQSQGSASRLLYCLQAPYIGTLPYPGEALINMMRGMKEKSAAGEINLGPGGKFDIGLSSLEAPSAQLATRLMLDAHGVSCTISAADTLTPDPRQPLRPVEYRIWRYNGMEPVPAVEPPDPAIAQSIVEIARVPYALERWYALARPLGQRLGTDALMSLLGVMVHPPATPEGWDTWDWLSAIQIASALTITAIDSGWEGSRRRAALISLIYGPMDWSGAAALIALTVLAQQDKRINIEFDRICRDLWHFGRGSAEWPHESAMIYGLIFLNSYSEEAQRSINAYFEDIQKRREEKGGEG